MMASAARYTADDLQLTSEADYSTLQKSINKIFDWSKTWQLKLANDKCQHNHISLSTAACRNACFVSDAKLPIVQNVRDLGVLVDNRLTFRDHINSIVSRGHVRAMQIWRCFLCKDVENLIRAFT